MPMSLRMRRCEKEPHPALSNRDGSEVSSLKVPRWRAGLLSSLFNAEGVT